MAGSTGNEWGAGASTGPNGYGTVVRQPASVRGTAMREHNIGVVRRWLDEGWTGGDMAVADDLLTDDFLLHDPVANREVAGRAAEQALISGFRKAIPDLAF